MKHIGACILLGSLVACQSEDSSSQADDLTQGSGGILSQVPEIAFGDSASGFVSGKQIDIYRIALSNGDAVQLEMTRVNGNLDPAVLLYEGGSTELAPSSAEIGESSVTKSFTAGETGDHYIVVGAYDGQGKGNYDISVTCTGGPCAGDAPPVEELTPEEAAFCLQQATICAFERLDQIAEDPGADNARAQLLEPCLAQSGGDDIEGSCANACIGAEDLCNSISERLDFYAATEQACQGELTSCLEECLDVPDAGYSTSNLSESTIAVCLIESPFNSNCDLFAVNHRDCGEDAGYANDSEGECFALCEATRGAWIDDLDTICDEQCAGH